MNPSPPPVGGPAVEVPVGFLMPSLGIPELIIILLIVLLLFGTTKLPALGKGLGEAIKNFKQGVKDGDAPPADPGADANKPKA